VSASSSQESATTGAFFFFVTGIGELMADVVSLGRRMSGVVEPFSPMCSSRREDWSWEVAVAAAAAEDIEVAS
jgi:hypothetical protein